jgi:hypothetical protein
MAEEAWESEPDSSIQDDADSRIAEDIAPGETSSVLMSLDGYTFDTLVGYDEEIARLRDMGIVDPVDDAYLEFVEQMKRQHGIYDESTGGVVVFKSAVREDADRLMVATAHELGHPVIRMKFIDGPMGTRALCVMATPGLGAHGFKDWGTLVLEGVDTWWNADNSEFYGDFALQESANSAMKAFALIKSSVANPKVSVFASVSDGLDAHSPLSSLLNPATVFEVPAPSAAERDAIWDHLMEKHVSMSAIDRFELVDLSKGMPRCDIFAAAKEAVVQAYRQSREGYAYVPVSRSNVLDKIAASQPLDSAEYRRIEDNVVEDFMREIERMEHGES